MARLNFVEVEVKCHKIYFRLFSIRAPWSSRGGKGSLWMR